jgi:hypothetical protein
MPVLLLAIITVGIGQIGSAKVYACALTDLGSCFSGIGATDAFAAGQQDAIYDHDHSLAYNNIAACCHSPDWNDQFSSGYNQEWNQYQSQNADQRTNVNIEGNGNTVNVGQTSTNNQEQNQGPSQTSGCENQCGGCNGPCVNPSCDSGCGGGSSVSPCDGCGEFHHFGYWHFHQWYEGCGFGCNGGFGYRHIGFGEDP